MKRFLFFLTAFASFSIAFASEPSSRQVVDESIKKSSPQAAVEYIKGEIKKITVPAERRALYAYLGSLHEFLCQYTEARESYAMAAAISAGNAEGMPKKTTERLVLDAVRSALCSGEGETALSYLNSAVRNSKSEEIQAQIKLYEQWAKLSIAEDSSQTEEPVALLKTYVNLSSMKSVKPSVLLTLWYTTGEKTYSEALASEFPMTPEAGIVTGKVQILPTPFWFFLPKNKSAVLLAEKSDAPQTRPAAGGSEKKQNDQNVQKVQKVEDAELTENQTVKETVKESANSSAKSDGSENSEKPKKLQLGLFRDRKNAASFVERLVEKGFGAYVQEETRSSGTLYYLVLVDENSEGNMALKLKSAGFESYPVF